MWTVRRTASFLFAAAASFSIFLFSASAASDTNHVYSPCSDTTVQISDGFSFGIAFASISSFNRSGTQLSPCDSRLSLSTATSQLSVFRPKVDEISLLTVKTSNFSPDNYGGYMVAFAGRKYAARSKPAFIANSTYTVTSFTLVLEFQKGRLQSLYWKRDGCAKCSGSSFQLYMPKQCGLRHQNQQLYKPWRHCRLQPGYTGSICWHRQVPESPEFMVRGGESPPILPLWTLFKSQGFSHKPVQQLLLKCSCIR